MRVTLAGLALLLASSTVQAQSGGQFVPSQGAFSCVTVFDGVRYGQLLAVPASACAAISGNTSDLLSSCASDGVRVSLACGSDTGNTSLRSLRLDVDFSAFPDPVAQADACVWPPFHHLHPTHEHVYYAPQRACVRACVTCARHTSKLQLCHSIVLNPSPIACFDQARSSFAHPCTP
jgi:hypothetical protein